jgi:hypothetical protein
MEKAKTAVDVIKQIRKYTAFLTLVIASTVIELANAENYFEWYYWLFLFLTFCGVNWLDKVKWFTGAGFFNRKGGAK